MALFVSSDYGKIWKFVNSGISDIGYGKVPIFALSNNHNTIFTGTLNRGLLKAKISDFGIIANTVTKSSSKDFQISTIGINPVNVLC